MEKTTKLDKEVKSVFHKMSEKKRTENPDYVKKATLEDNLYYRDEEGRECINNDIYHKITEINNRDKAISEHGNDRDKRLDLCCFPKNNREFVFNYDHQKTLEKFHDIDFKISDWLFFYGSVGTGKTTLASSLMWEWMKNEPARKSSFVSVRDWIESQLSKYQRKNSRDKQDFQAELPNLNNRVILDDFDKIKFTEWQMLQIFRLVDHLDRNNHKVIITANYGIKDLYKKSDYDLNYKAALDRVVGRCKKSILKMDGPSYRNDNFQI